MGPNSTKVFGVHGGSVGRGTDNEWILPDPERYLSGKHLRIDFRAGNYVLVDTSSNGTYVNGSQQPLGKYRDHALKEGDYVRVGEYELLVSIDKNNDFAADPETGAPPDGRSAVKHSTANDLGADLDVSELLEAGDPRPPPSQLRARNAYGQPMAETPPAAVQGQVRATPWHMLTRPLKAASGTGARAGAADGAPAAAAGSTSRASGATADAEVDPGLAAFCRGAGIDPRNLTGEARAAALQTAGQLLRESVLGLMDLNHGRHEFRNRFRIPPPATEGPESPLNFSHGVDEALVRLLTTVSTRAGSVDAIRTNFRELKAQNAASLGAMHAAFEEFLGRVDPKELEERFERTAKRGVFGTQNKGRFWDLYGELYAGLAQRPPDGFPHAFNEAFAKAYQAKLRKLVAPPRNPDAEPAAAIDPNAQTGS